MSTGINISSQSGLTVGTTAVTSGTDGRVFFQAGGVIQQNPNLFWDNTNSRLSIGQGSSPGARLDVRAQGALSTNIAFRVRNSADTADIFSIRGNNEIYLAGGTFNGANTIYHGTTSLIKYSHDANADIAIGQGATFTNATYYNTIIGSSASSGASAGLSVVIGFSSNVNSSGGIAIGDRALTSGTNAIVIGTTGGVTRYSGTNSIHLGTKGNQGNSFDTNNIFATYFASDSVSTVAKSNGSFGLLGQQGYFFTNGTGTYGVDTFMGNGGNTFVVRNHPNIPSTNITDSFQQYSADITAGNAAPHFRTENGSIIKLYQQSSAGIATVGDLVTVLQNLGLLS